MITKEMIQLVNDVDSWAQRSNKIVDRQLESIYRRAQGTDNGWGGVAKEDPSSFYKALAIAHEYKHMIGESNMDKLSKAEELVKKAEKHLAKNWKLTIDVTKEWGILQDSIGDSEEVPSDLSQDLVKKLKTYVGQIAAKFDKDTANEYENLIENIEMTSETVEDFDYAWNDLYDWADANDIWIKTF